MALKIPRSEYCLALRSVGQRGSRELHSRPQILRNRSELCPCSGDLREVYHFEKKTFWCFTLEFVEFCPAHLN